eukprot:2881006-Rhodomonas_salina.4
MHAHPGHVPYLPYKLICRAPYLPTRSYAVSTISLQAHTPCSYLPTSSYAMSCTCTAYDPLPISLRAPTPCPAPAQCMLRSSMRSPVLDAIRLRAR